MVPSFDVYQFATRETAIIRCDDVFADTDVRQFEKICAVIRRYDFDHRIGLTVLGEGKRLWAMEGSFFWKVPFANYFINYHLKKITGEKYIGENKQLERLLENEFNRYAAIPVLHGLHHYAHSRLSQTIIYKELSGGIESLKELFNMRVKIFTPPFGAWNLKTELVCKKLNLTIDKCSTGFDRLIRNMNSSQIEQLGKEQSSVPEVYYHPHRITNLEKFELYLKTRRKYI